jgi:hypothetical protein
MNRTSERGAALLMALLVTLFISAIGGALVLLASTETRIAGAEEWRHQTRGVAEVLLERVLQDLAQEPDWNAVLAAGAGSTFRDPASPPLDLAALTLNVQRESDDLNRWGVDGPQWRLYAFGPADSLIGARARQFYAAAWVADDPGEGDGNPSADRNETIQVRADAFGPRRTRVGVRATVRRKSGTLQLISWSLMGEF